MEIEIINDFIPIGRKNRPGISMKPKYITIHDTANPRAGADALAHAQYLKSDEAATKPVSWHFTVDDKRIVQHLPINEVGWHAGDGRGPGNMSSIGVEICENADGDRMKAELLAIQLVARLCQDLDVPVLNVVQHNTWVNKDCPRVLRNRQGGWDGFIAAVKTQLEKLVKPAPAWKSEGLRWLEENGFITPGRWRPEDPLDMGTLGVILSRLTITGRVGKK